MTMASHSTPTLTHHSPRNPIMWISEEEASRIVTASLAYETMVETLLIHAHGDYDQPFEPNVRPGRRLDETGGGRLTTMSAYVGDPFRALGAKLITGFPVNVAKGLPRASGVVVLFDPATGAPIAIMSCQAISARRTAAAALARSSRMPIRSIGRVYTCVHSSS